MLHVGFIIDQSTRQGVERYMRNTGLNQNDALRRLLSAGISIAESALNALRDEGLIETLSVQHNLKPTPADPLADLKRPVKFDP